MIARPSSASRPFARALLAVSAVAALAAPTRSFAQAPTFNTVIANPTGSAPWQPPRPAAVGDFDRDGKLDALIVDGSPALRFMRGNGDGSFSRIDIGVAPITTSNVVNLNPGYLNALPHGVDGYMIARAADVDGDGRLDVVCMMVVHLNWTPLSFITVMINQGNDVNGTPQFAAAHYSLNAYDFRSLTVGDLNGDGKPDFIVGHAYGQVRVYLNNGDGTFTAGQTTTIMPNVGGSVGQGVIADINGDGRADFVVTDGQAGVNNMFLGNGDGTLQAPIVQTPAASSIAVADLNNDGKPDLIEGMADGSVSVFLGHGDGTFGSPANFPTVAGGGATGFSISDVNGDGKLDVAVGLYNVNRVAILTGNGDGTLGAPYLYGGIARPVDVTLADFNGDGKPDIASVSANGYGGQNYDVLTNTTVAGDTKPPVITAPANITTEAMGPSGAVVTFTATATDNVDPFVTVTADKPSGSTFPLGTTTVRLSATDAAHNTATASFTVTVVDTTPPDLNIPVGITFEATGPSGAVVSWIASATDIVDGLVPVACTPASGTTFGIATTQASCSSSDVRGNTATGHFPVTVRDTTPPVVTSAVPSQASLWPPNKKMVPISVAVTATDAVTTSPSCKISSVSSNEPGAGEWLMTGGLTLQLQADRLGTGNGRIYTITVTCSDAAGNAASRTTTVTVPHDQGK